jgi:hypothetical protein
MALHHSTVSFRERRGFATRAVRHVNNLVKACVLDVSARAVAALATTPASTALTVVELACGRGQDVSKVMYAARAAHASVRAYHGLDLAEEDVVSARLIADRYLSATGTAVDIRVGDMCAPGATDHIPAASADLVLCQLAVHYAFGCATDLDAFMAAVARVVTRRGFVVLSYTDGRSVVRRARAVLGRGGGDSGGGADSTQAHRPPPPPPPLRVPGKYYAIDVPQDGWAAAAAAAGSPFGLEYTFHLAGSIEGLPEFLTHEPTLLEAAARHGLVAGVSTPFDAAVAEFMQHDRYARVAAAMGIDAGDLRDADAMDTANLYRYNVLSKSTTALRAWVGTL